MKFINYFISVNPFNPSVEDNNRTYRHLVNNTRQDQVAIEEEMRTVEATEGN